MTGSNFPLVPKLKTSEHTLRGQLSRPPPPAASSSISCGVGWVGGVHAPFANAPSSSACHEAQLPPVGRRYEALSFVTRGSTTGLKDE